VAIKVSNAPAAASPLDERLRQEARILARLEHPGVVPVHDAGTLDDGRMFYVMKLVRGETLAIHAGRLAGEAARLAVFERVVEAVAFAHAAGVVHRDLKPSNVMVGAFGEVLVLDWGLARLMSAAPAPGGRVGTPGFMAPEQRRGEAARVGPAADVFALGALLYWLLDGDTPPDALDEAERRLASARGRVPVRLRAIALKCLATDPHARYLHAGDLAADLGRYRAGDPVSAHRDTWLEQAGRWLTTYRTFIVLVVAYLIMRAAFAFFTAP
jgi:serine/threonine protein kinase